jgi:hypothetical protein
LLSISLNGCIRMLEVRRLAGDQKGRARLHTQVNPEL